MLGKLPEEPQEDVEAAAWLVAEATMRARFGRAEHLFDLWRQAATGAAELTEEDQPKIRPFVETAFGLRESPISEEHVQGWVAEAVWFLLATEVPGEGRRVRRIEAPSFYVTAPGGDGLVTYEVAEGALIFRLWEIKKHTGSAHLSQTVTRACKQLGCNGSNYIAQYVALAPEADPEVAELYGKLVDLWVDAAAEAGVGVAVGTSLSKAPKRRCFSGMQEHFPRLDSGDQLEGLVTAISDFPAFARCVREFVWSAL